MARPGITFYDVEKAAHELVGKGKTPTIDGIRSILGTGSISTIAPLLREWKAKQDDIYRLAAKEDLPEELVSLLKGLWQRVLSDADNQVDSIKQTAESQIEEHRQSKASLENRIQELQQQNNKKQHSIQSLTNEKLSLDEAVRVLQTETTQLKADANSFDQRLDDKQCRIDELTRLNNQVQTNLDHYRVSIREQRLKEQKQYEQQIKHLEQSLHQHQKDNAVLTTQFQKHQEKRENLQAEYNNLKVQHNQGSNDLNTAQVNLSSFKNQLEVALKNETKLQSQLDVYKNKFENEKKTSQVSQKQLALAVQKLEEAEKQLSNIEQQNKSLAHDKWILGQEKAELVGQVREMGKIA